MNERIKMIRQALCLNQTEFGKKISIRQTTVAGYENGTRTPMDSTIMAICKTYNVSEIWLRTGEGEMFNPDPDDELAWVVGQVYAENDEFKKAFVTELLKMDDEGWKLVKEFINGIANRMK